MNVAHDLGGTPDDQPIDRTDRPLAEWERRAGALVDVLCQKRLMTSDELRRGIETLSPESYRRLAYYERWSASLELLLVEKGLLTTEEIDRQAQAVAQRWG